MTDRHAFLAAIKAHPDDDTPRLVFADWLDEHGEPERAELVRADVEYSKMLALDRYRPDLARRRYRLLLRFIRRYGDHAMALSRGILEEIHCAWAFWVKHGDRLYDLERPWRVRLTTVPDVGWEPAAGTGPGSGLMIWLATAAGGYFGDPAWFASSENPYPTLLAARWPGTEFELADAPDVRLRPPCPR